MAAAMAAREIYIKRGGNGGHGGGGGGNGDDDGGGGSGVSSYGCCCCSGSGCGDGGIMRGRGGQGSHHSHGVTILKKVERWVSESVMLE